MFKVSAVSQLIVCPHRGAYLWSFRVGLSQLTVRTPIKHKVLWVRVASRDVHFEYCNLAFSFQVRSCPWLAAVARAIDITLQLFGVPSLLALISATNSATDLIIDQLLS